MSLPQKKGVVRWAMGDIDTTPPGFGDWIAKSLRSPNGRTFSIGNGRIDPVNLLYILESKNVDGRVR